MIFSWLKVKQENEIQLKVNSWSYCMGKCKNLVNSQDPFGSNILQPYHYVFVSS